MDYLNSIAVTIGLLAGLWGFFGGNYNLLVWVGFISWACYYASGTQVEGLIKTIACNLIGVLWGFLIVQGSTLLNFNGSLAVAIAIGAFFMVAQARIKYLSFVPGAFAGAGAYFGAGLKWQPVIIALVIGAVLGYISDISGKAIMKKEKTDN